MPQRGHRIDSGGRAGRPDSLPESLHLVANKWYEFIRPSLPPPLPNFTREFAAALGRGSSDHFHGRYAHGVGFPFHAQNGGEPLPQADRALRCWVVLARASAKPQTRVDDPQFRIASPAVPNEVFRICVLFMAVQVSDFYDPGGTIETTNSLACGRAGISPVPQRSIGYLTCFLPPIPATLPGCIQSWSSAPSSSSS